MPKITKDQIQFIDGYLEKAGMKYIDVRYEMTDHVAAALENYNGDFYENFKEYMVVHKKDLMDSNRHFRKLARNKAFGILKNNFLKLPFWIITAMLFLISMLARQIAVNDEAVTNSLEIALVLTSSVIYFYFIYYWLFKRDIHSVITKLLTIVYFGSVIFRFSHWIENTSVLLFYYAFSTAFYILLAQSVWQLNKQYKGQYNG